MVKTPSAAKDLLIIHLPILSNCLTLFHIAIMIKQNSINMKAYLCFSLFLSFLTSALGQVSLGPERMQKLKNSVVRILIDGEPAGTGFFVGINGELATCWHVIESTMLRNSENNILGMKKVEIELYDGKKYDYGIHNYYIAGGNKDAVIFDYCLLVPRNRKPTKFDYLKRGNFSDINEGDIIYSCGYPLGIQQQFISTGILSTKWKEIKCFVDSNKNDSISRDVAWLDLTMNKGNSGGPIIKLGNKPEDDVVIGIATFILNPWANESSELINHLGKQKGDFVVNGVSQNGVYNLFAEAIKYNSIGISGCVSIDHFRKTFK